MIFIILIYLCLSILAPLFLQLTLMNLSFAFYLSFDHFSIGILKYRVAGSSMCIVLDVLLDIWNSMKYYMHCDWDSCEKCRCIWMDIFLYVLGPLCEADIRHRCLLYLVLDPKWCIHECWLTKEFQQVWKSYAVTNTAKKHFTYFVCNDVKLRTGGRAT
jgi:hypothetical protein